jgi:hypothetical protein
MFCSAPSTISRGCGAVRKVRVVELHLQFLSQRARASNALPKQLRHKKFIRAQSLFPPFQDFPTTSRSARITSPD